MAQGIGLATFPGISSTAANMSDFFSADPTTGTVRLWPTSLSFGNQQVATSAAQAITLTNTSAGPVTISSIAIGGANPGDFAQTNTCGSSLAASASCTINVTFTPTATGVRGGR